MPYLKWTVNSRNNGRVYDSETVVKDLKTAREFMRKMKGFETPAVDLSNFRYVVPGKSEKIIRK